MIHRTLAVLEPPFPTPSIMSWGDITRIHRQNYGPLQQADKVNKEASSKLLDKVVRTVAHTNEASIISQPYI